MGSNTVGSQDSQGTSPWASCTSLVEESKWCALYTCARHEKLVHQQLTSKAIESFLPLYKSLRRWNDRTAWVELPLFPGYLFVHIQISARLRVLTVPGVVRLVGFNGQLACLREEEIQAIKSSVALQVAEPCPYLVKGRRVRIATGPLKGIEGIVVRRKGSLRAVISVHSIMQSFSVELDAVDAQLIG